jgi:predicted alpha-1,6-mannanase (GH76 family)
MGGTGSARALVRLIATLAAGALLAAGLTAATATPAAAASDCPPYCDGRDPALARADRAPVPVATTGGRTVRLHVSDPDNMAWASVEGGAPGDQVWLDRTWDGGTTWTGGLGSATTAPGESGARTAMYQVDDAATHHIGGLRACARAAGQVVCTWWGRSWINAGNRVKAAATALMGFYDYGLGRWPNTGWWNAANALTTLIDYDQLTGTSTYRWVVGHTYTALRGQQDGEFRNDYIDDAGWWGLAWLRAYDLTGERRYLDTATTIAEFMYSYWDDICGGGVWWSVKRTYKNAITNELYLALTAGLHNRLAADTVYLQRAKQTWAWFDASGMINPAGLVNDGLRFSTCKNNGGQTWTYNQGVVLGGLVELAHATGDASLLGRARSIADAVLASPLLVHAGVLTEPCGVCAGGDVQSFKGAFVRNLGQLDRALAGRPYQQFLLRQGNTLWAKDRTSLDQYGLLWTGPIARLDAAAQHSALDAFLAPL